MRVLQHLNRFSSISLERDYIRIYKNDNFYINRPFATNVRLIGKLKLEMFLTKCWNYPRHVTYFFIPTAICKGLPYIAEGFFCSRSKDARTYQLCRIWEFARVSDRICAIGLFRYKSSAANKGLYPKKLPRGITRTWIHYWLFQREETRMGRGNPVLRAFNWDFIRRIRLKGYPRRIA